LARPPTRTHRPGSTGRFFLVLNDAPDHRSGCEARRRYECSRSRSAGDDRAVLGQRRRVVAAASLSTVSWCRVILDWAAGPRIRPRDRVAIRSSPRNRKSTSATSIDASPRRWRIRLPRSSTSPRVASHVLAMATSSRPSRTSSRSSGLMAAGDDVSRKLEPPPGGVLRWRRGRSIASRPALPWFRSVDAAATRWWRATSSRERP